MKQITLELVEVTGIKLNVDNMTPKEKAKELVKWSITYGASKEVSKLFSVKLVDEIINAIVITDLTTAENQFIYWEEVKQEIQNI